ncbi:MAG TPA: hypothetical protein DEH11_06895, partial [Actinobacteria bacterium]|nr:hypothetical protein [Actinomycetota bacterium]
MTAGRLDHPAARQPADEAAGPQSPPAEAGEASWVQQALREHDEQAREELARQQEQAGNHE